MANEKISELPVIANPLDGTEVLPVVQAGDTSQASIQNISDYVRPYKVYSALLNQNGINDPTAIVLENTIGNIVWTRDSGGVYFGTLTGAFTADKTFFIITPNSAGVDNSIFTIQYQTTDYFALSTSDGVSYLDGLLINTPVEIRVYN